MPDITRFLLIVISILFFIYIIQRVSAGKLLLKYSLLWLLLSALVFLGALFPQPLFALARVCGFATGSNFLFLIALFFILAIALSLSVIVSKQQAYIKTLIQDSAILRKRIEDGLKLNNGLLDVLPVSDNVASNTLQQTVSPENGATQEPRSPNRC